MRDRKTLLPPGPAPDFESRRLRPVLSVVIPAHNSEQTIASCLSAVMESLPDRTEVVVVDDGSTDHTAAVAARFAVELICLPENVGAAEARNIGARRARGDLLFFLDADIVVGADSLRLVMQTLDGDPGLAALFGSYGPDTPDHGICSQYKNLLHHYTHQTSSEKASTFCGGFGAVRREVFLRAGGFDRRRRALEDIEFGYRLHQAGHRVLLLKQMQLTHLKRYTLPSLLHSDLWNRAVPWTELMLRYRIFRADLNTKPHHVASVGVSVALPACLGAACLFPVLLIAGLAMAVAFVWLNRGFFSFVYRIRGLSVTAGVCLLSWLIYMLSSFGFLVGASRWLRSNLTGEPST